MNEADASVAVLPQLLVLLALSVLVVAVFGRLRLPPIVGHLAVGTPLGPHALDMADETVAPVLSELGVVFLVFTLGLEFSLPRMVAMRKEVIGVGGSQVLLTTTAFAAVLWLLGIAPVPALLLGGALSMSSTAIVIRQLTEQGELNSTHSRLAIGILLFQDLAFVPLLAMESALGGGDEDYSVGSILAALLQAAIALGLVLTALRWAVRPLFHEIGRSRSTDLFTLAVLLVSLGAAWATHAVGLSMALGAFLAGMLLAETEYRHQIEAVIRPFRDVLLGLFFITIGMLLDLQLLGRQVWLVLLLVVGLQVIKGGIVMLVARRAAGDIRKSLRAGIVVAQGGEFGFALLTLMLSHSLVDAAVIQPLLAATVLGMATSPLLIRYNSSIADFLLRRGARPTREERESISAHALNKRDHVIVCGFGRVGQHLARVLVQQGFQYVAIDMDSGQVQGARLAGEPVIYGDAMQTEILQALGLDHCKVLVVTFAEPEIALGIVHAVRKLRPELPILVRTPDDNKLELLQQAGATEVVPETLEASLMLISHVLLLLDVPMSRVVRTVSTIRGTRYSMLRRAFLSDATALEDADVAGEEIHTVVLPPGAYAVGKLLSELNLAALAVTVTGLRRDDKIERAPDPHLQLRQGDSLVLSGAPQALEQAERLLLMG